MQSTAFATGQAVVRVFDFTMRGSEGMGDAADAWTFAAMNCHHRFYSLDSFFRTARENGYTAIELWTGPQHFYLDHVGNDPVERLLELERAHGVKVIGICPEQTNPKPNNMACADASSQERTFKYFCRAIDVAHEVQARQVVVTSGWAFLDEDREAAYDRCVAMLRRLARYACERGVLLAVEALQPFESVLVNSATDLRNLIADVGEPSLKACLDMGAMACAGETIPEYFKVLGTDIVHVHFVDVEMGEMDTHRAWGDGTRNMADDLFALSEAGYCGALSVETVSRRYHNNPAQADRQSMRCYLNALDFVRRMRGE